MIKSAFKVQYVKQWRRFWAFLLDLFLYIIFFVPVTIALLLISFEQKTIVYFSLYLIFLITFFQVYLTVRLGGSVGKLTFDIKVVTKEKKYINMGQAVVRTFPFIVASIYLVVFLGYILNHLPNNEYPTTISKAYQTILSSGKVYFADPWIIIVAGILVVDHMLVFAIPGKQTLHDLLAGTYAITRESFYAEQDNKNPYLLNVVGKEILLKNYRANSILEKILPQKALVKSYIVAENKELNLFLLVLNNEIKLEERGIVTSKLIVQLQNEHTSLRPGRNQVVYLLAPPANIDFERQYELLEEQLQFIDFVVVE